MRLLRRGRNRAGAENPADAVTALASAQELVDAGKFSEAIQLLTEANRAHRDRRLEQRLVDVRSDAFDAATLPVESPSWPHDVPDLFPGARMPEIASRELTVDAIRSAIQHHGSLIVRGLIGPDRVAQLVDDIERSLAAYDARASGLSRPDLEGWYEPFPRDQASNRERKRMRGSVMTVESPPTMFDLLDTFESVGLSRLVRDYFGEPPTLLARKGTLRRIAKEGKHGGWHQDGAFMGAGIRSLNIWLALTHCGDTAPGLDVVGRRLDELVQTGAGAFAAWATSPDAAEAVAAGAVVRPIFEPGDILIFDHMNLHRTAIEPGMSHDRYAIETWLFAPSTYPAMTGPVEDGYTPRDQVPIVF